MRIKTCETDSLFLSENTLLFMYPSLRLRLQEIPCREEQGTVKYDAAWGMQLALKGERETNSNQIGLATDKDHSVN